VKYILLIAIGLITGCTKYEPNPWTTTVRLLLEEKYNDDKRGCKEARRNCERGTSEETRSRDSFFESQTQRER